LLIGNVLSNRVVPPALYVPTNLLTAAVVYVIARRLVTPHDIGLRRWKDGARWGVTVTLIGLAAYTIALVTPGLDQLFHDRRVDNDVLLLVYHVGVRIPFGTVLLEELAFRGVLPAVFAKQMSTFRACVVASALFGLWHVFPSLNLAEVNPVFESLLGTGLAGKVGGVAIAVFGTFLAGLWLCFLRYRSGSLLAPVIVHIASNAGGYLFAWIFGGGLITTEIRDVG
jgi:membrane protease YdiL (CAAX protease family)